MKTMRITCMTLLLGLTALATSVSAEEARPPAPAYRIIVHPKNPASSVERTFLRDAFLKKATRWPHDKVIHPADLASSSAARARFSNDVLGRSLAAIKAYWQQRIFSGRDVPPPELDSDEKVVAYVLKHEGAVGYVSGAANIGSARQLAVAK